MQKDTPKTFKKRTQSAESEYEYDAAAGQLVRADGLRGTAFIGPEDVQQLLGCSRKVAREHLRDAGARVGPARSLVRLSAKAWNDYARATLGIRSRILLLRQRWQGARRALEH